jgi:histidinol-phosphate aminotransferase
VFEQLKTGKILVKYLGANPLMPDCLRVTVSSPEENALFVNALGTALKAAP